ncbi:MAG: hypothetical protein NC191_10540, partial [Muribaculaceae bacterium]|nr:hypothetical protein [Muribaculaceae bacterium]
SVKSMLTKEQKSQEQPQNQTIELLDTDGNKVTIQYDENGLVTTKTNHGTREKYAYNYDNNGNVIQITNPKTKKILSQYTYDDKNRVLSETHSDGCVNNYTYNDEENSQTLTRKNYYDKIVDIRTAYYDGNNRPIKNIVNDQNNNPVVYSVTEYDDSGNPTAKFYNANDEEITESQYITAMDRLSANGFFLNPTFE